MILTWSLLALGLLGAEGQQPSPPRAPLSPACIEIGGCRASRGTDGTACGVKAVSAPDSCLATMADRRCGACVLLEEISANLCPEDLVDEMTVAANNLPLPTVVPLAPCETDGPEKPAGSGHGCPAEAAASRTMDQSVAQEVWPMTLPEAIEISLDNSEIVRVLTPRHEWPVAGCLGPENRKDSYSGPTVIARLNADASIWRFKAEVMAELRSVEQQYWNLAQAHVQLWAADRAVTLAEEVLHREQGELLVGHGTVADVAEAQQRLEQLRLDLVTRTSDMITTERQLRNLLGLPPADNRRIIPVTAPAEARLEPDWDSSLAAMLAHQPDIVRKRILVRIAELQLLMNRNQLLPLLGLEVLYQFNSIGQQLDAAEVVMVGSMLKALRAANDDRRLATVIDQNTGIEKDFTTLQHGMAFQLPLATGRNPLANCRQAQHFLLRSRAHYRQLVHQTTHSLARFFLEIDANYKQFKTASRLRADAAKRLNAQRAYYEEGRITADRFLDAVSQYAAAVATEAQYQTAYNVSIVALEEAKGTLLAYDDIVAAEGPRRRGSPKPSATLTTGDGGSTPAAR